MDSKYRVFSEQYNAVLDLIEKVDDKLANDYKRVMDNMPKAVLDKMEEKSQFIYDGKNFRAMLEKYQDQLCFEYTTYDKYFCTSIVLQPYYEDELDDLENNQKMEIDTDGLFLFALSFINTEDEPSIRLNYTQENNEYKYVNSNINGIEINTEVFLKRENGRYYLISRQNFIEDELIIYEKKVQISYSDLIESIGCEDDEDYVDETEI